MATASREFIDMRADTDLSISLAKIQNDTRGRSDGDQFVQSVSLNADSFQVLLYNSANIEAYRTSIRQYDHIFLDATGNVSGVAQRFSMSLM